VDPWTQTLVRSVLEDVGQAEFAVRAVREATEADPRVAGRLALWGRRLVVGEALSQSQRVAVERDALASLLVGGINRPGADLAEMGRMFAQTQERRAGGSRHAAVCGKGRVESRLSAMPCACGNGDLLMVY
jgi:hypothetical protein